MIAKLNCKPVYRTPAATNSRRSTQLIKRLFAYHLKWPLRRMPHSNDSEARYQMDASGNVTTRQFHGAGLDEVLAEDRGAGPRWSLTDVRGSVRQVVDSAGTNLSTGKYTGFGKAVQAADSFFSFTGLETEALSGLQYNRARWYDAGAKRWMSEDPIGFGGGDANLNRYVGNEPTNRRDPSGLQPLGGLQHLPSPTPPVHPGPPPNIPNNSMTGAGEEDPRYIAAAEKYRKLLDKYNAELAEYKRQVEAIKQRRKAQISWMIDIVPAEKSCGDDLGLLLSRLYSKKLSSADYLVEPKSLEDAIDQLNKLTSNGFSKIRRLVFRGHGGCSGGGYFIIGNGTGGTVRIELEQIDPTSKSYSPAVVRELEKLRDMLTNDAKVILWSCYTGGDPRFMQLLANILLVEVQGLDVHTKDYFVGGQCVFGSHWFTYYPGNPVPAPGAPGQSKGKIK